MRSRIARIRSAANRGPIQEEELAGAEAIGAGLREKDAGHVHFALGVGLEGGHQTSSSTSPAM